MPRAIVLMLVLAVGAQLGARSHVVRTSQRTAAAVTGLCSDSTSETDDMIGYLQALATSRTHRDSIFKSDGGLPDLAASEVAVVRDTTVCRRAAEALRRERFGADTGELAAAGVIRYGTTRYVASDYGMAGEWHKWAVMDTSYSILSWFNH